MHKSIHVICYEKNNMTLCITLGFSLAMKPLKNAGVGTFNGRNYLFPVPFDSEKTIKWGSNSTKTFPP
jgi:hypothetical protein